MNESSKPAGQLSPLKQALLALDEMQSKLDTLERAKSEPIAIIGIGCRFPGGANDPEAFWQLMRDEVDAISEVPADRWNIDDYYDPDPNAPGKMYTKHGGFLDQVDKFDAQFFGISPREAVSLDPQQRLLLEVSWEALENAGVAPDNIAGSETGVFIGVMENDYSKLFLQEGDSANLDAYFVTGNHYSFTAGRISYVLGLHGPGVALDTACSSSLAAIHLACQSLRSGESNMALAGGVNLILSPELTITMCKFKALSPEGRCKTFDSSADGFVQGEGCGIVVLKRLSDAIADDDNILAVIRGSAINHDGPSGGLTVPNGHAQQAVIRKALANAGVQPEQVSYVEAHGTGTSLGDPIEVRALGATLGDGRTDEERLVIGSVKTNVGHLDSAAGVAGLIKIVLSLQHEEIPAHLHFNQVNPHISLSEIPVTIPTERIPWPSGQKPRIAGISSFGLSGTNVHMIVEEAPRVPAESQDFERPLHLLALSAKSEEALKELSGRFAEFLASKPSTPLADVCFTANTGRARFEHRLAVVAESAEQLNEQLVAFSSGREQVGTLSGIVQEEESKKIAFLFTGQGAQYVGMGRQLYETQPTFRKALDKCDELLRPYLEESLLSLLYDDGDKASLLDETMYTQPALFALEYALAQLWMSWGIKPSIVMGHSVGEYTAACIAGIFSLEDGLKLIAERGRLMQSLPKNGLMAVAFAAQERVEAAIAPYANSVSIAAVNGPGNIVVSGEREAVQAVVDDLKAGDVRVQPLNVSHAFHSVLMDPILDEFEQTARQVQFHAPQIPLLSNMTGQIFSHDDYPDATYWRNHIREAVQFSSGIETLYKNGYTLFLEVGPNPTLLGMGRRCLPNAAPTLLWLPSLRKSLDDWQQMLESVGNLYIHGLEVDWASFDRDYAADRRRVMLPTYPFQRQRYWLEKTGGSGRPKRVSAGAAHPLLGQRLPSPLKDIQFETQLSSDWPPFLADHQVYGTVVVPGTAFLEMALAAADEAFGPGGHQLENVTIREALILPQDSNETRTVQLILSPDESDRASFQVASLYDEDNWKVHVTGNIRLGQAINAPILDELSLSAAQESCREELDANTFYGGLRELGLEYGPTFRGIAQLWGHNGEVLGKIQLPNAQADGLDNYRLHPALLDAAFQLTLASSPGSQGNGTEAAVYLPVGFERIGAYERPSGPLWGHVRVKPDEAGSRESLVADVRLLDGSGHIVAEVESLFLRRATREALQRAIQPNFDNWLYEVVWETQKLHEEPDANKQKQLDGTWLIFDDHGGIGTAISQRLQDKGEAYALIAPGAKYQAAEDGHWTVNPSQPKDFERLLREVTQTTKSLNGVIYLWGLDVEPGTETEQAGSCGGALHLMQALVNADGIESPGLWLVTRGAQSVGPDPSLPATGQATLWGLGRMITSEHPDLGCVCVDLEPWSEVDESEALLEEIRSGGEETLVALRGNSRYVARLARGRFSDHSPENRLELPQDQPFKLDVASPGLLPSLVLRPVTRQQPGPGKVEIRVQATGLNFKDVLKALGRYPIADSPLGDECAGTVAAVGEGVEGFQVGDRVVAMAYGSFRSFVVTPAELVVAIPDSLSFIEVVTLPIAYLTAYFTLYHLGKMSAGKRVLIHAAAGGVGMMAVQLAQQEGAEIFATAGSPRKRALLRSMGVQHVMNSRTLDFADEVMAFTDGQGVDIVLNSLSGDFIPKSLSVLAPDGCFLEIGKTDIWDEEQVAQMKPKASYYAFYLGDVVDEQPELIQDMMQKMVADLQTEKLLSLRHQVFPIQETIDAFQYMAQAKHIGKIVISQEEDAMPPAGGIVRENATYLITGGLGGLGLEVAKWLVSLGASHLVLVGRSGAKGAAAETVNSLEEAGVQVLVGRADVSDKDQVAQLLTQIEETMPPLRGIIHAAAVLDDGVLLRQTWDRFEKVFAPKVDGAWNLHTLTQHMPLDFFVLFSSWAALVGLPGQGNYVAANAFLDALAHHRRARGLAGLSINWGAWAMVGLAAAMDSRDQRRLDDMGVSSFIPEHGIQALQQLLLHPPSQAGVFALDWTKYCNFYPATRQLPFLTYLAAEAKVTAAADRGQELTRKDIEAAAPAERRQLVEDGLREMAARVLRMPVTRIDVHQPLSDMGLDSLMSTEFFAQIERIFGKNLPLATLIKAPTISQIADLLTEEEQTVSWSSLVEIQPGNSENPPFFLVHAEEGNILFYRDLAHQLGQDQPIYGLQAQGLSGEEEIVSRSIEEMAALYIEEIRTVQPHGPYLLGGFCLGGGVAYEMAQQLQAQDEEVALLVMIQPAHQDYKQYLPGTTPLHRLTYHIIERFDYEANKLSELDSREKLSYLLKRLQRAITILETKVTLALGPVLNKTRWRIPHSKDFAMEALSEAHKRAFWDYKPRPYQGRVVIFRASKQPLGIHPDPMLGWGELINGQSESFEIEAYHQTILDDPQAQSMAQILQPCMIDALKGKK